jgi:hypothetical protein
MVLRDASLPNMQKEPHVHEVYVFVHICIEFCLPEDSSAVVIKS